MADPVGIRWRRVLAGACVKVEYALRWRIGYHPAVVEGLRRRNYRSLDVVTDLGGCGLSDRPYERVGEGAGE